MYEEHDGTMRDERGGTSTASWIKEKSDYQSGFERGVADAKLPPRVPRSVLTPTGNVFSSHTQEYYDGWLDGFCSISPMSSDDDWLTFTCPPEHPPNNPDTVFFR
jgi:hypothetical protein